MADPGRAVFLSYASQDADAARRICDALQAAGVEVWFDQSELRGGDAWDGKIRRQIKECALFIPVISANTNARLEGYFRREWRLAVERMHDMDDDVAFLLPVVIDDTPDAVARVPERFRERQWTRLKGGETPAALGERVKKLLSGDVGRDFPIPPGAKAGLGNPALHRRNIRWWWWVAPMFGIMMAFLLLLRERHTAETPATAAPPPAAPAAPSSEATDLIRRARAMTVEKYDSTADDYAAAEALVKQALVTAPNDGEVWAFSSVLNKAFVTRGFDRSPVRSAAAREQAERALKLVPDSIEAQYALAYSEREIDPVAAEKIFRHILELQPDHPGSLLGVSNLAFRSGRLQESQDYLKKVAANPTYAPLAGYLLYLGYFSDAQFDEAEQAVRGSIALKSSANSVAGLAMVLLTAKGDADGAAEALASASASRNEPRTVWMMAQVELCRRRPDDALNALDRLTDDFIRDSWYIGPKAYWVGRAHALAGRPEAARLAWQAGLAIVDSHLEKSPETRDLHLARGELLGLLGRTDDALHEARVVTELDRGRKAPWFVSPARIYAALGRADDAFPLLKELCPPRIGENVGWALTPALFRLDPLWDKVRDDPHIRALAGLAAGGAPATAAPAPDKKSVAVLPFANMSDEKDSGFFTDGIQEDILTNLSNVHELRVVSRTSVLQYRGTTKPMRQIAAELGVAYILEGSVRRVGNKVRVTGQLIHAATDEHVWAKAYDRDLTDVFGIQSELAQAIAVALQAAISPAEKAALDRKPTDNPAAYDLYLKARALRHVHSGEAKMRTTESLLAQAVALDPNFAEAWAELADCRADMFYLDYDDTPELQEAGKAAAAQALRLAPDNPTVIGMVGNYYVHSSRDYARATEQYLRLAQQQPNSAEVFFSLGSTQVREGRWVEALANLRRAHELDPGNPDVVDALTSTLTDGRRYAEAEALAREQIAVRPGDPMPGALLAMAAYLGRGSVAEADEFNRRQFDPTSAVPVVDWRKKLARMRGDYAEAVRLDHEFPFDPKAQTRYSQEMEAALDLVNAGDPAGARVQAEASLPLLQAELLRQPNNSWVQSWLGQAYALLGDKARALEHADRAKEIVPESRDAFIGTENAEQAAAVYAWAGQRDHALAELARLLRTPHGMIDLRPQGEGLFSWASSWKPLENDPAFKALLADPANRAPLF